MLVLRCCDRHYPEDGFALVDFSCPFSRIAGYLRRSDDVSWFLIFLDEDPSAESI